MTYDHAMAFHAGIIGASGFTGAELLRLLAGHPAIDVAVATADTQAGHGGGGAVPVARRRLPGPPADRLRPGVAATSPASTASTSCSSACPHQASMALAPQLVGRVGCVVDLSAAYRLKDASLYPRWYGFEHDQPELLAEAVYGLPERHREDLVGARLVATPGLLRHGGDAGPGPAARRRAGRAHRADRRRRQRRVRRRAGAKPDTTFCAVDENFTAYGLLDHRHTPEIEQNLDAQVLFTPHLAPMNRGILATCYARPAAGADAVDGDAARRARTTPTTTSRSSSSSTGRRRRRPRSAPTPSTSRPATTSAPAP